MHHIAHHSYEPMGPHLPLLSVSEIYRAEHQYSFQCFKHITFKREKFISLALIEHVLNPSDTSAPLQKAFPPT